MRRCPASHICAAAGAEPEITSSDTVPVSLRVTQHVSFGEVLKIAGQPHALGGWRLTHAPGGSLGGRRVLDRWEWWH